MLMKKMYKIITIGILRNQKNWKNEYKQKKFT